MGNWTPSIVPSDDQTVYLVVDDFGRHGRAWRETDIEQTDLETVIIGMLEGQYNSPVRIVGFNTSEGWSRDEQSERVFCPCGGVTDLTKPYWRKTLREARKSADEFDSKLS